MVFGNIVVAYDGSEPSLAAVKKASEITAGDPNTKLHVLYITMHPNAQLPAQFKSESFDPQKYLLSVEDIMDLYNKTIAEETEMVEKGVGDILEAIKDQATIEVIPGYTPAANIIAYAKKIDSDLIVMGSRGLGAIRGMLGSVSFSVLRETELPVLIVK